MAAIRGRRWPTLRLATITAGNHLSDRQLLAGATHDIAAWENAAALELARPHGGQGGLSSAGNPAPNGQVAEISPAAEPAGLVADG